MKVWLAKDEDGFLYLYQLEPEKCNGYWCAMSGGFEIFIEKEEWPEIYEQAEKMEPMTCEEVKLGIFS